MRISVEMVVGYDGDGRPHEVIVVDGHEADVTYYEIDSDDRELRRGNRGEWLRKQLLRAGKASPQAARWIRHWAAQTAEHGEIDPDDVNSLTVRSTPPEIQ